MRRTATRLSDYHLRLHVAAQERATRMLALLKAGATYPEVSKAFGVSETAVRSALRRQGLRR
jgi:DNA-directed RNA polymerase specialized sigma24 family protein